SSILKAKIEICLAKSLKSMIANSAPEIARRHYRVSCSLLHNQKFPKNINRWLLRLSTTTSINIIQKAASTNIEEHRHQYQQRQQNINPIQKVASTNIEHHHQ
ncbi:11064_t:CDS:2, partial [Entrophospora sp. SA101]